MQNSRSQYEYDLFLRTDFDTSGYTQWFFFRISNLRKGQAYKFNIMNFVKPNSLYNYGMKILCCSANERKGQWKREGMNIAYYKNSIQKNSGGYYYTLTFTLTASSEEMYVANDHPYSYTDLQNLIKEICTEERKNVIQSTSLCKTIAGNECPMLTVTNFDSKKEDKKAIVFTARVHPGYFSHTVARQTAAW